MTSGEAVGDNENEERRRSGATLGERVTGPVSGVLRAIRFGMRAALLRPANPGDLSTGAGAFAGLALFDLLLHLALAVARTGPDGQFTLQYFPFAICHIPLLLLAGFWIGRLARRDDLCLPLAALFLATGIPLDLLAEFLDAYADSGSRLVAFLAPGFDHFYPFYIWWALAILMVALRLRNITHFRRVLAVAVLVLVALLPLWYLQRGELWGAVARDAANDVERQPESEEVLYRQPELLREALDGLKPGRKGIEDLYFIGFAGYGSQDVFRKELEVINSLLRARFDTAGRSLLLVNNPETAQTYPFASVTALERALKRVGQVMDRDEDILLLYLTSHGSEDHRLAAELQPFNFRDIEPVMLREMLDRAGIRWRVVIVSACYSGTYIDALKGDDTLVMTASDASSSSFGCSSDSDFTWFGKALFDEELRTTFSFAGAFKGASRGIAQRENREGEEPSHPQMFVGKNIEVRLKRLAERLEARERARRSLGREGRSTGWNRTSGPSLRGACRLDPERPAYTGQ